MKTETSTLGKTPGQGTGPTGTDVVSGHPVGRVPSPGVGHINLCGPMRRRLRAVALGITGQAGSPPYLAAFALRTSFGIKPSSLVILLLLSTLNPQLSTAFAQTYSIDWSKVSGGGGASTGGVYAVSGTIGQHDAGTTMSGGNYSLTGGFWSLLNVVQTPGAPLLSIRYTTTNTAVVSWPSPSTGFGLQFATDLTLSNWSGSLPAPTDDGTNRFLIVNPPTGNRFFRLVK